jgi:uncharacterized LabA/DUF88 family protein/cold shock CspA family protein
MDNLMRNGGWGLRYDIVKSLAEAQGTTVLRANAYMARDAEREAEDYDYRQQKEAYRDAIRRNGFHLILKEVKRYRTVEGEEVLKANADLDLAVDAMLQCENLDYILLGTGDGDFLRLVRALQSRGKRVDLLSFANTSGELRREVDNHHSGFLIPGLLPVEGNRRMRGYMHYVQEQRGFGFLTIRTGLGLTDVTDDVFCHINDFVQPVDNLGFAQLKLRRAVLEFDLVENTEGKPKAARITDLKWTL